MEVGVSETFPYYWGEGGWPDYMAGSQTSLGAKAGSPHGLWSFAYSSATSDRVVSKAQSHKSVTVVMML